MISEPTSCKRRDPHLNKAGKEINCINYLKWHINSVISRNMAKSLERKDITIKEVPRWKIQP